MGKSNSRNEAEKRLGREIVRNFLHPKRGMATVTVSDGSVIYEPFGADGCAVSIIFKEESASIITRAAPIGATKRRIQREYTSKW